MEPVKNSISPMVLSVSYTHLDVYKRQPLVQRKDDKPETVRHRLEVYHAETEPLKGYYEEKGILTPVDNQSTIEDTTKEMCIRDRKKDLFNLRLQHATNQLDNPIRIAEVKKDIARVKTIIREQQLAGR